MNAQRLARLARLASGAALVGAVSLACGKDAESPDPVYTNGPDRTERLDATIGVEPNALPIPSATASAGATDAPPDVVGMQVPSPGYTNSVTVDPSRYSDAGAAKKTNDAQKQPKTGPGESGHPPKPPKGPLLNSPNTPRKPANE